MIVSHKHSSEISISRFGSCVGNPELKQQYVLILQSVSLNSGAMISQTITFMFSSIIREL